jgi:hypothetical protein
MIADPKKCRFFSATPVLNSGDQPSHAALLMAATAQIQPCQFRFAVVAFLRQHLQRYWNIIPIFVVK